MKNRGMHAVTVQSGLQKRCVSHRTILSGGPRLGQPTYWLCAWTGVAERHQASAERSF
jgi:hypothetical protein